MYLLPSSSGMITLLERFLMEPSYHAENTKPLERPQTLLSPEADVQNKNLSGNKSLCTQFFQPLAFFFFFNWGIVVLQCCVSFYSTAKWSSLCYTAGFY